MTVIPITTVTSVVPPGGHYTTGSSSSYYVFTTAPTASSSAINGSDSGAGGGDACLCHTCALTPTVVPGAPCGSSSGDGGGVGPGGPGGPGSGICTPRPGTGTTTFFTTHTITHCGMPAVCPAPGYVIGGNATQSGATVVTTTDKSGHTVTYTQIPTGPSGGGNRGGPGSVPGGGLGTGTGTGGVTVTTTNTALPTCPYSNNVQFTSPMGMIYDILCNDYFTDATLDTQTQGSLGSCIAACDMFNTISFMIASPCRGVSWYSGRTSDNCELKEGTSGVYREGIHSARLRTPYGGPSGGNGTGGGGSGPGGGGLTTVIGSMTAPPIVTTYVTGGSTIVSTYITGGSTVVSTYVTGGSTVVQTVTGGGGGGGNGPGGGGGSGGTGPGGGGGGGGGGTGPGSGAGKPL